MVWFYWAGLARFLVVLVGWVWGLIKLSARLVVGTIKGAITVAARRPRRDVAPSRRSLACVLPPHHLVPRSRRRFSRSRCGPRMSELLADLTGYEVTASR